VRLRGVLRGPVRADMPIAPRGLLVYRPRVLLQRWSCRLLGFTTLAAGLVGSGTSHAHFVLQSPAAMHEQSGLGDPQKAPPCGDNGNAVATNMVTAFKGGDVIKITINETIYHPGHYRIALAVNDISELPAEPPVTAGDSDCGSTTIQNPPAFPVLADGVFLHDKPFDGPQSIDVTLPADVNCDNCTLQVIQFMSNHGLNNPGGCFYHHCAAIAVESGPVETSTGGDDTGGTAGTNATTVTTDPTNATNATGEVTGDPVTSTASDDSGSATGTGGSATAATGNEPTTGGAATSTATATASAGEASTDGANGGGDGGCGCDAGRGGAGPATLLGLLGLLGLARRRRVR